MPRCFARPAVDCQRELERYREDNPQTFPKVVVRDISRGETRLMAEVLLDRDTILPDTILQRARLTLEALAWAE